MKDPIATYGTINRSGDVCEEVDLEGAPLIGSIVVKHWKKKVQIHRLRETLLYLFPLFLSACTLEVFNLLWKGSNEGYEFNYSVWIGFGGACGGFGGRLVRMFLIRHEKEFSIGRELEESMIIALSLLVGPSSSFYWFVYCSDKWNLTFTAAFFYTLTLSTFFYSGAPLIFRGMFQYMRGEKVRCTPTQREFVHDTYMSLSVGFGFAFMLGTSTRIRDNWFSLLSVTPSTLSFVAILTYGFLFSLGFTVSQIAQNAFLPDTWTDNYN